jgi:hypothetical protein
MDSSGVIRYVEKIVPDAYHGTELGRAKSIEVSRTFDESRGPDHYLGDGVYFYEASRWHAFAWAKRRWGTVAVGIIRATINLGRCLDLSSYEHRSLLRQVRRELLEKGVNSITDAVVINFFATMITEVDSVRGNYGLFRDFSG